MLCGIQEKRLTIVQPAARSIRAKSTLLTTCARTRTTRRSVVKYAVSHTTVLRSALFISTRVKNASLKRKRATNRCRRLIRSKDEREVVGHFTDPNQTWTFDGTIPERFQIETRLYFLFRRIFPHTRLLSSRDMPVLGIMFLLVSVPPNIL